MKKMAKIITVTFIIWISFFFVAIIAMPDKEFSETENRYLAAKPSFSLSGLINGDFANYFENYINDQFIARDFFVQLNTSISYLSGLREINDVYIGTDNCLFQKPVEGTESAFNLNTESIKMFTEKSDIPVYFALIPNSAEIQHSQLPSGIPIAGEKSAIINAYSISNASFIDVYGELEKHNQEYIYYHTDHHWTSLGAYYGYKAIGEKMGLNIIGIENYKDTTVSSDFLGTLYSKAPLWFIKPDEIHSYVPETGIKVSIYEDGSWSDSKMYFEENLDKKDKYTYFLGQNQPLIKITSENTDRPNLLIIRDSYSDSLAPFMANDFSEIHLMDPRYYKQSVADYISENKIDEVLICYSLSNFAEDKNLSLVLSK